MVINGVASSWSQIGGVITSEISNSNANNPTSTTSSNLSNQSNVTGGTSLILINGAPASWKTAGTVINSSLGISNDGTNYSAVVRELMAIFLITAVKEIRMAIILIVRVHMLALQNQR